MDRETESSFLLRFILQSAIPAFSPELITQTLRAIGADFFESIPPFYAFLEAKSHDDIGKFLIERGLNPGPECDRIAEVLRKRFLQAVAGPHLLPTRHSPTSTEVYEWLIAAKFDAESINSSLLFIADKLSVTPEPIRLECTKILQGELCTVYLTTVAAVRMAWTTNGTYRQEREKTFSQWEYYPFVWHCVLAELGGADEDEIKALDQKYQALLSDSRSDFENSVPLSRQSSLAESEASNAGEHTSQNAILGWPKSGDVSNSQFSTPFRPSAYSHSNQPSKPGPSTVPPTKQKRKRNRSVKTVPYDANDRTFALLNAPHISEPTKLTKLEFQGRRWTLSYSSRTRGNNITRQVAMRDDDPTGLGTVVLYVNRNFSSVGQSLRFLEPNVDLADEIDIRLPLNKPWQRGCLFDLLLAGAGHLLFLRTSPERMPKTQAQLVESNRGQISPAEYSRVKSIVETRMPKLHDVIFTDMHGNAVSGQDDLPPIPSNKSSANPTRHTSPLQASNNDQPQQSPEPRNIDAHVLESDEDEALRPQKRRTQNIFHNDDEENNSMPVYSLSSQEQEERDESEHSEYEPDM